jgi:hypothetical protein
MFVENRLWIKAGCQQGAQKKKGSLIKQPPEKKRKIGHAQ